MDSRDERDLEHRLKLDLLDSFDEELELELDDRRFDAIAGADVGTRTEAEGDRRRRNFASCCGCRANWSSCRTGSPRSDIGW